MVLYMKVRNKYKWNIKIFCEKFAMETWNSLYNAVDFNTANNNLIQINDNMFINCCPIIIIKSIRIFFNKPWISTGLKNSCKQKKQLYIAFLKSKTHQDYLMYKRCTNKLTFIYLFFTSCLSVRLFVCNSRSQFQPINLGK